MLENPRVRSLFTLAARQPIVGLICWVWLAVLLVMAPRALGQAAGGVVYTNLASSTNQGSVPSGGTLAVTINGSVRAASSRDTVLLAKLMQGQTVLSSRTYPFNMSGDSENPVNTIRMLGLSASLPVGTHQLFIRSDTYNGETGDSPVFTVTVTNAAPVNDAQFVSMSGPPASMTPGQTANVTVEMRNSGTTTWQPTLGHKLGAANPTDNLHWGFGRVDLSKPVAPGAVASFAFTITAPRTAGTYNFQWKMLREFVEWFGAASPNFVVTVAGNPTISLSSPANGTVYPANASTSTASVTVSGSAGAASGSSVAKIELLDGGAVIDTVYTSNYNKTRSFSIGGHLLQMRVTDSMGRTASASSTITVVAPTNAAPTVNVSSPASGRNHSAPRGGTASVIVAATATDPDGTIQKMEILKGGAVIHTVAGASVNQNISLPVGTHTIRVRATDNSGATGTSSDIIATVEEGAFDPIFTSVSATTTAGTVAPGGTLAAGIKASVSAGFSADTVTRVELRRGSAVLASSTYPVQWSAGMEVPVNTLRSFNKTADLAVGTHQVYLRAYTFNQFQGDSQAFTITVTGTANKAPSTALTTPVHGQSFTVVAGTTASVNVIGSGTDPDGSVSKLELIEGTTVLASVNGNAINQNILLAPGIHLLQSRATDNLGATATSSAVTITVKPKAVVNAPPTGVLTSPAAGARFVAAGSTAPVRLVGSGSDTDGNVAKIELMMGNTAVATLNATTINQDVLLPIGTHLLRLRVTDNLNAVGLSPEVQVNVVAGTGEPVVTLTEPTHNTSVAATAGTATVMIKGTASDPGGAVTKIEVLDGAAVIASVNGATIARLVTLNVGTHAIQLRATDNTGKTVLSSTSNVSVTGPASTGSLLGAVFGVRLDGNNVPNLVGWVCQDKVAQGVSYKVSVNAPLEQGGVLLGTGVANLATDSGNAAVQALCHTPGAGHHFSLNLAAHVSQYAGAPLFVQASNGSATSVLPCEANNCTMPGNVRIALTSPVTNDRYSAPATVFMRAQITNGSGSYDEVAFNINGEWINASRDATEGAFYASKLGLAASATPYIVYAKVRQGKSTLYSAEGRISVAASGGITLQLNKPANGATAPATTSLQVSATPGGSVASVTSVKFYANGALIGTGVNSGGEWKTAWISPQPGNQAIMARAFNANGAGIAQSSVANVGVGIPSGGGSSPVPVPVTIAPPHLGNPDAGTLPGALGVSANGAATYSIPIAVPPGTAGVQPSLSLDYSSSGMNGLLGLGWSLGGMSSIHRCGKTIAQDGVNSRIAYEFSDRLCLDGQRLVLVNLPLTDQNYWSPGAEYRTEIESFIRVTTVAMPGGDRSFKVERKDGRIFTYGNTASSNVKAIVQPINGGVGIQPAAKSGAQAWAISRMEDRIGNYVAFEYQQDGTSGEHRPTVIRYGAKGLAAHAAVQFTYETRPDAWKRYIDETRNDLRSRISAIMTYVAPATSEVVIGDGTLVREYKVSYETSPTSGRSLLASVQGCARNPQTRIKQCLPATEFTWGKPDPGKRAGFESKGIWSGAPILTTWKRNSPTTITPGNHSDYFAFSDFDNDGYGDVLEKRVASAIDGMSDNGGNNPIAKGTLRTQYRYFHNTGTGFSHRTYRLSTGEAFVVLQTGDFDGDGALDLLASTASHPKICLSPLGRPGAIGAPGSVITFACTTRPATGANVADSLPGGVDASENPYAVDVKGDGRTALYSKVGNDRSATLYIQNEVLRDTNPPSVLSADYGNDGAPEYTLREFARLTQMVDFSGIGKPYDVRWSRPRYSQVRYDADGMPVSGGWENLRPTVSIVGFKMPGDASPIGEMRNHYHRATAYSPNGKVQFIPYLFDTPHQGAGLSADFNGSGYSSLAYGFLELAWGANAHHAYSKAEMTLCLSTGRALDCAVRKKYSDGQYAAVRAVGNFIGDGQASILTERMIYQSGVTPQRSGEIQMCRVSGDDTTATSGVDNNMTCEPWPGVSLTQTKPYAAGNQVYFMDLLGTGRTQLVYYHSGKVQAGSGSETWIEDGRWEVFAPIDLAVTGQALDRIHQVRNGLGALASVNYVEALAAGVVRKSGNLTAAYPTQYPMAPGKIVSELRVSNGVSSDRRISYRYLDPAFDAIGRGALGFAQVVETDELAGIMTTRGYRQDWPFVGMEHYSETSHGSVKLSTVNRQLKSKGIPQAAPKTTFPYDAESMVKRLDLNGADLGTESATNTYGDDWGNLTAQVHVATEPDGVTKHSTNTTTAFRNDSARWLIGLPTLVSVTKIAPAGATVARKIGYDYDLNNGLVSRQTVEPGTPQFELAITYHRTGNEFGLVSGVDQTWYDPVTRTTRTRRISDTEYDGNGRFSVAEHTTVNGVRLTQRAAREPGTGVQLSLINANKLQTRWTADGFGRVYNQIRPDGNETRAYLKKCNGDCPLSASLISVTETFNGSARTSAPLIRYSDHAGHLLRAITWGADGRGTVVDLRYDSRGRLAESDWPRFETGATYLATKTAYDVLSRVTAATTLDESGAHQSVTTHYNGLSTVVTNARRFSKTEQRNSIGQLVRVTDARSKFTSYEYDPFGNLSKTTDPNGNVITVSYDRLGRKTDLRDPNLGWIHYDVDPLGLTYSQTSPKQRSASQSTRMAYDELGRMTARYEPDLESHWIYDTAPNGIGQLAEAYTGAPAAKDYRRLHSYDSLGRPTITEQFLTDGPYKNSVEYDAWGRVVTAKLQRGTDAEKVFGIRYDLTGAISRVERGNLVLWQVSQRDEAHRAVRVALGNNLIQDHSYSPHSGRLVAAVLKNTTGQARLSEGYQYDPIGSVTQRTQYWDTSGFQESFTYDALNRLSTSAMLSQAVQTFQYDDAGNLTSKTGVGNGLYAYPTQGPTAVRPHAVTGIPGIGSFAYDANGNLESGAGRTIAWSSFDMPQRIAKGNSNATFVYGPEHQRTRQNRNDGSVVVYAGAQEVETKGSVVTVKTYWPGGIGVEIDRPGAPTELNWTHTDRLGSVVALTDQSGAIKEKLAYDAWGKRRSLDSAVTPDTLDGQVDNKGYTGHEMLDQLDLVHMNGRVYDPLTARFLSVDPLIVDPLDGQNYNRYSYVLNNPTNLVDPSGFGQADCTSEKSDCDMPKVVIKGDRTKSGKDMATFSDHRSFSMSGGAVVVTQTGRFGSSPQKQGNAKFGGSTGAHVSANNGTTQGTPQACREQFVCGLANTYDEKATNFHKTLLIQPLCSTGVPGCTLENALEATSRHPAPHNGAGRPVRTGSETEISFGISGGHVTHVYDAANFRVINVTQPDHKFYKGIVIRSLVQEDGVIYSHTYGVGNNEPEVWFGLIPNQLSKFMNIVTSPIAFSRENRHIQKEILNKSDEGRLILQQQDIRRLEAGKL